MLLLLCLVLPAAIPARIVQAEQVTPAGVLSPDAVLSPNKDDEIVYFDGDNAIHVYDPNPSSPVLKVEWASPDNGWANMALGDLTGDGDMEIVAIRQDGSGGRLTIFDPVAQDSPDDQVQMQNNVPWAILYTLELSQPPRLVATGEFDTGRAGREILFSYGLDNGNDHFVILHSTGEGGPGRGWEEQRSWDVEGRWSAVATGNMYVDDAIDEVALVSFDEGELGIFRVEPKVVRTFTNVNREQRWRDVAFGQFVQVNNDGDEIGAVRDADIPLQCTWVFRYNGTSVVDQLGERISPSPTVVFFANIFGNGDEELVLLRQVQQELGPRPRLIVRDGNNNDTITLREDLLDGDNEYKGGDGGDIDGDGRDEIVLVRNNRIRIYNQPESASTYQLVERFTNGQTVELGNVDAAGLAARSRLFASLYTVSGVLLPGVASSAATVINVLDATKGNNLPFTLKLEGAEAWAKVSRSSPVTPSNLSVTFTSEGIQPGEYHGRLLVDVQTSGVQNDPLAIELSLRVLPVVTSSQLSIDFVYYPCEAPLPARDQQVTLSASGPLSDTAPYTAQIEGNPDWVTVAPEAGALPEEVRVSVDPAKRPADIVSVDLLVTVDLPNEPGVINRIPINLVCPAYRMYMPAAPNEP
jgi:hypothetical protein